MNRTYESVSTHNSDLLCTTSAYRTSQAVSFNSIVHEGTVYLSIAHSPLARTHQSELPDAGHRPRHALHVLHPGE